MIIGCKFTQLERNSYCCVHDVLCSGTDEDKRTCYHWCDAYATEEQTKAIKEITSSMNKLITVILNKFK